MDLGTINIYICDLRQIGIAKDYPKILNMLDGKAVRRILQYLKEDD